MAAPPFIAARVSTETKSQLRRLAEREQITESALVRQLLETVLRTSSGSGGESGLEPPGKVSRDARLSIRLAPDDRLLLTERAAARNMAVATYVSVLVRSHLRALVPLPKEELMALKRSVAELGAIGRNLNQIARVANQGGHPQAIGGEHVRAILKVSQGLRDHVKGLLRANERSWSSGYADAPH